ncbi:apolipoprotein N-acyltransferase [Deltaproteobacteria bacterium TL4]
MPRLSFSEITKVQGYKLFLASLSGGLLVFSYPDHEYYGLVWMAFIPLFFALQQASYKEVYWLSVWVGMILVCGGYPWISHVAEHFMRFPFPLQYVLWLGNGFFVAQLFALIFLGFTYFKSRTAFPTVFLFPVLTVTLWSFFPNIFYFTLGNGTSSFLTALQATEFTGAFGLDFMIALSNILGFELLRYRKIPSPPWCLILGVLMLGLWLGYGRFTLKQWDQKIETWDTKKIGIVQMNRPMTYPPSPPEPGYSYEYPMALDLSKELAKQGAEVIVWPEGLPVKYGYNSQARQNYSDAVKAMDVPLIIHGGMVEFVQGQRIYRNSSFLLRADGTLGGIYHKRFLVLLGEYIPWLGYQEEWVERLGIPPSITPGARLVVFKTAGMLLQPLICYEIIFSHFVAESIGADSAGKVLVVQSNDGWYGKGAQSAQHRSSTVLRAVENRVPVIHVINNGESSVIAPNGRYTYLAGSWVREYKVISMPYHPREGGSFFTHHPGLFLNTIRTLACLLIFWVVTRRWHGSRKSGQRNCSARIFGSVLSISTAD